MTLPEPTTLALAGIAYVLVFGLWRMQLVPRLLRRETHSMA